MTEKRFVSEDGCCGYYTEIIDNEKELDLSLSNPKKNLTIEELVDLLNDLSEDNEYLEKRFKEEEWHYNHIDEDRDVWRYKCQELEKVNEQLRKENKELRQDNDIKFWKHQFMTQHNTTQLILHELHLAMNEGYEFSDKFKEWLGDLREKNKEVITKHERLFE